MLKPLITFKEARPIYKFYHPLFIIQTKSESLRSCMKFIAFHIRGASFSALIHPKIHNKKNRVQQRLLVIISLLLVYWFSSCSLSSPASRLHVSHVFWVFFFSIGKKDIYKSLLSFAMMIFCVFGLNVGWTYHDFFETANNFFCDEFIMILYYQTKHTNCQGLKCVIKSIKVKK